MHLVRVRHTVINIQAETTSFQFSFCLGNYELVKILIGNGSDINARNMRNKTSLMFAAHKGTTSENSAWDRLRHFSLIWLGNYEAAELLINHGGEINAKLLRSNATALYFAAEAGKIVQCKLSWNRINSIIILGRCDKVREETLFRLGAKVNLSWGRQ